jgi:hypothetical protein
MQPIGTEALPLFMVETMACQHEPEPLPREDLEGMERSAAKCEAIIRRLIPLAQELAEKYPEGVIMGNIRLAGVQRGLITEYEASQSGIWAVCPRAGLVSTSEMRRSGVTKSHGNLQRVWKHSVHVAGKDAA